MGKARTIRGTRALGAWAALTSTACGGGPFGGEQADGESGGLAVAVEVTSDTGSAARIRVEVDARKDPRRVDRADVPLPYTERFPVPLDTPFPLHGASVEAAAGAEATWIACRITLDGEVVAQQRADGAGAVAVCEKKLRIGPQ